MKRAVAEAVDESGAPQGALTSVGLMRMVQRAVARRLPNVVTEGREKFELLSLLERELGARAVVEVGLGFRELPSHPVFEAISSGSSPEQILARWRRLEVFGHTRHRTRVVASRESSVVVEHYDVAGQPVGRVSDLFVWGLLVALLERSRVRGVVARLGDETGPELYAANEARQLPRDGAATTRLFLSWTGHDSEFVKDSTDVDGAPAANVNEAASDPSAFGATSVELGRWVDRDPLRTWKVGEVARHFGQSPRALQRTLTAEGTTFSETILRARVDAARRLLDETELSPTEIAFCVGFADAAHFSRVFRRFNEIPPTAYRGLRADVTPPEPLRARSRPKRGAALRPSSNGRAPS